MATWTSKVDYTDKVLAADFNALQTLKADIKKVTAANLGTLDAGEFGFVTDTLNIYIGSVTGNKKISGVAEWAFLDGQDQAVKQASDPEFANLYKNQPLIYRSRKVSLSSPYTSKAHVYKGQLHCHTTNSDGVQSPTALVTAYRDVGYDFISITDHDFNTPDPAVSGILFIPGVEDSSNGNHLVRINAATAGNATTPGQAVIDLALAAGSFVHIAHPNWPASATPSWTDIELESLEGHYGVEVWNSFVSPDQNAEGRIDTLLSAYRKFYLLAVDDCHDVSAAYAKTASVRVFADSLTSAEIMENLKRGNFYSSNGAEITSIVVSKRTITVTTPVAGTIDFIGTGGAVKQTKAAATSDTYTVFGNEVYVRIKITRDSDGKIAWTNPVYVLEESVAELAKGGVIRGNIYATGVSTFNDPGLNHIKLGTKFSFIGQDNFYLANNVYYSSPSFYYTSTGKAEILILLNDGSLVYQNAPDAPTPGALATFTTRLQVYPSGDISTPGIYAVGGIQVVGARGAAVADATDATSVILRLNELLARIRTHGLIAT